MKTVERKASWLPAGLPVVRIVGKKEVKSHLLLVDLSAFGVELAMPIALCAAPL